MFIETEGKPKTRAPEERHVLSEDSVGNISLLRSCENFMEPAVYKHFVSLGLVVISKKLSVESPCFNFRVRIILPTSSGNSFL